MYLAYPAPDDEEQALAQAPLRAFLRDRMKQCPDRFVLRRRRRPRRLPVRRGSDDPLRLMPPEPARRRAAGRALPPAEAGGGMAPEAVLRELLAEARQRGLTLAALAERAGYSEKTFRRRLKSPETIPLGEYCRIVSAARTAGAEGGT